MVSRSQTLFTRNAPFFFRLVVILIATVLLYAYRANIVAAFTYSFCDTPIRYKIGEVDKGFNLTETEFTVNAADAAKIWNDAASRQLFVRDPEATLTVNMIFDKRQSLHNQVSNLEDSLDTNQSSLDQEVAQFEKLQAAFKQRLQAFNDEVATWNTQGGAPPTEYARLTQEQNDLRTESSQLNQMARKLNRETDQYNNQVADLNQTVNNLNTTLKQRPEEGLYLPSENRIEIYFNITPKELVHTLTHEFGHSLGLGHTDKNTQAIMYPLTSDSTTLALEDRAALTEYCTPRNRIVDYSQMAFYTLTHLKIIPNQ